MRNKKTKNAISYVNKPVLWRYSFICSTGDFGRTGATVEIVSLPTAERTSTGFELAGSSNQREINERREQTLTLYVRTSVRKTPTEKYPKWTGSAGDGKPGGTCSYLVFFPNLTIFVCYF